MKIKSPTQPIENAEVFDIYTDSKKIAVCLVAADGFELVKENDEPRNIRSVDIPAAYEDRVCQYTSVPWTEKPEAGEDVTADETPTDDENSATEADYINALTELGVKFDE